MTGKLGDVLQESARAALAYIRRHATKLGVPEKFYLDTDLHVHLPEGAIPKDGPSAGIALLTSMVSAVSGRRARQDVAMTGEITLRGAVLRIGGLKEKVLAARRYGVKTVIFPDANRDDLDELPKEVRSAIEFIPVRTVSEALAVVLEEVDKPPRAKARRQPGPGGSKPARAAGASGNTGGKRSRTRRRAPDTPPNERPSAGS
jgi:ATP-dependent Lon protease